MEENLPIMQVAMGYIDEEDQILSSEMYSIISAAFKKFISNQITYEECKAIFEKYKINLAPLQKIESILKIVNGNSPPLPYTPDNSSEKSSSGRRKARIWTAEEDKRLIAGIHKFGLDDWKSIVNFVGAGRTRPQCAQRWNRGINPKISKRPWTEAENKRLLELVKSNGETLWSKIAELMGNRSDVQCRYHFFQLKRAETNSTPLPSPMIITKPIVFQDKISREQPITKSTTSKQLSAPTSFVAANILDKIMSPPINNDFGLSPFRNLNDPMLFEFYDFDL